MTTFTEIVAAAVVHSSSMVLCHFGVTLEPARVQPAQPPAAERVVARTPRTLERAGDHVITVKRAPVAKT